MSEQPNTDALFKVSDAFAHGPETDQLFLDAMREMTAFHRQRSPVYDGICRLNDFDWDDVETVADLGQLPHIIVTAFKEKRLLSLPESEIVVTYTSSGTTGQKSQINWDAISRERQLFMRRAIVESYGLADYDGECNYLCLSYDPESCGDKGAANTFQRYMEFCPARETFHAITEGPGGEPEFRQEECVKALERFAESDLPLRIVGFVAFGYVVFNKLRENGVSFQFPLESLLFSGGGWKSHSGERVTFLGYAELVHQTLGIAPDRIRDVYGMVEHGVPYVTCERNHFHVPVHGRVFAIDPGTLRVLPEDEPGLLKLLTPYIRSAPAISVLSTDFGTVHSNCPCGRSGQHLTLGGRAGVKKHEGCAISASQLIGQ